jgi:diaminohydroxyphosphoribosylaminopyrimidine deaminase/5-amino-6-(5-phosphoribosylamino)uracil reductase
VVVAQSDPTETAGGGAAVLRAAGVEVIVGVLSEESAVVNEDWTTAVRRGRPVVTWKCATSLDGRVAGPDGGPTALTGPEARAEVHRLRARVGAIIVGTGTVLVDDPQLTVRLPEGSAAAPLQQPIRVVMGTRAIPDGARVLRDDAPTLLTGGQSPEAVLADLYARGVRHALLEGGPGLAAAFLRAGLIDRVEWYVAPVILGDGPVALPPGASDTPIGLDVSAVGVVGEDVRIVGRVRSQEA